MPPRCRCAQAALLLAVALAGCAEEPKQPDAGPDFAACLTTLKQEGAQVTPLADFTEGDGCGIVGGTVRATVLGAKLDHPATMRCSLAAAVTGYEQQVLEPLAERYFHRQIVELLHYGSYVCRGTKHHRLSEHAVGLAIDIAGVKLSDGRRVMIEQSWRDPGPAGQFWQQAARAACGRFSVVLSPAYDSDHQNHIHVDLGPYRACGV